MASVSAYGPNNTRSIVDYSIRTSKIRYFVLHGETLFSATYGIAVEGWKDRLVEFV